MSKTFKVVSWNIAGGHPIESLDHFDYKGENLPYFVDQLTVLNPDIINLQESHTKVDGSSSNAEDLAKLLNYKHVYNSPASPSHIDKDYRLSTAIISKHEFKSEKTFHYPDPDFELLWKDGSKAETHKKNLQVVHIYDSYFANNQLLPLSLFGYNYDDKKKGSKFAHEIEKIMEKNIKVPVIWSGDFNYDDPLKIYPFMKKLGLKEALPDVTTRPSKDGSKKKSDHILYSPEFELVDAKVVETNTDHYLCYAEFRME